MPDLMKLFFTDEVMRRLRNAPQTMSLQWRRLVLTASGPAPPDPFEADLILRARAQRAAWEVYIDSAHAVGLLDAPHDRDLVQRLTSVDDDQFRSAIAECLAAWYFRGKLGLPTSARPTGARNRPLELLVKLPEGDMHVEVKSPLVEPICDGVARSFDDSGLLEERLAKAASQFGQDTMNLLFLTGRLTLPIMDHRRFLSKAFYADQRMVIPISKRTGEPTEPMRVEYTADGRFLKHWGDEGPRHTRVSGVMFVEEHIRDIPTIGRESRRMAFHDALVMHNPNATYPLPEDVWGDCPQFVRRGDELLWTDGHQV